MDSDFRKTVVSMITRAENQNHRELFRMVFCFQSDSCRQAFLFARSGELSKPGREVQSPLLSAVLVLPAEEKDFPTANNIRMECGRNGTEARLVAEVHVFVADIGLQSLSGPQKSDADTTFAAITASVRGS